MKNIRIYYHFVDADGQSSAYLMKWAIENKIIPIKYENIYLERFTHGYTINFEKIRKDDMVIWLDCSPELEEFEQIYNITDKIWWIDHHKYVLDNYQSIIDKVFSIIDVNYSACQNVYNFILENGKWKGKEEKRRYYDSLKTLIDIIGYYDIHKKDIVDSDDEWYEKYVSVNRSLEINSIQPDSFLWKELEKQFYEYGNEIINQFLLELKEDGQIMSSYIDNRFENLCRGYGQEVEFEGLNIFALNIGIGGSSVFKSINYNKYDAVCCFIKNVKNNKFSVSLYSDKEDIDLIKTLKKYDFRGHQKAGNFKCKDIQFEKGKMIITI